LTLANYVLEIYKFPRLNRQTLLEVQCKEAIIDSVTSFKKRCKGLNNLMKFTNRKILDVIENTFG
jgi:hypothetical protein